MGRFSALRPLLLPALITVVALTAYNARIDTAMGAFEAHRTAGRHARAAAPVYGDGADRQEFQSLPVFALVMAATTLISDDAARVGWYALSCACLLLFLRWSALALPARRWTERSLILVALALLAGFYVHELTLGRSNVLVGVLLIGVLGTLQIDAPRLAAVGLAAAVCVKPAALLLVPWLMASYGVASGLIAVAAIASGLLLPAVVYGWAGNLDQVAAWWHTVIAPGRWDVTSPDNISLTALWSTAIGPGSFALALTLVTVLLLLAVAATMWRQRARAFEPDYAEVAFLMLLIPLISPLGRDGLMLLGTPAVICVTDRWRELRLPWRIACGAALSVMGLSMVGLGDVALFGWLTGATLLSVSAVVLAATLAQMRLRALA